MGLGSYAAYHIYLLYDAYAKGDQTYEQIAKRVILDEDLWGNAVDSENEQPNQLSENIEIPAHKVDFSELKSISEDAIGWLYCPDTVIDYPLIAADDYTFYLSHLADGTYNINGSLFLDYHCEPDFSNQLSVIYGHSMKTGKMFGTLEKYKKQSYFEKHPYFYLYTEEQNYRIALIYGAVLSADQWINEEYYQNADDLLEYVKANTTFDSSVKYSEDQRLVVLSTCSYDYSGARYVLMGVLQPENN
jgi:sortase B